MMPVLFRYPIITLTVLVFVGVITALVMGAESIGRWVATVYVAVFISWTLVRMVRDVLRGHVGLDILALVAMIATLAVGEYVASLIIVLMLSGGEALEDFGTQTPMGRPGQPAEMAPAFVFLASPESSYVSGETLAATGGMPTP